MVKSSFFQLKQVAKIEKLLKDHFETVIHAFITTLDWITATYVGVSQSFLPRLQLVQKYDLTGKQQITSVLYSLHWLPAHFRVHF